MDGYPQGIPLRGIFMSTPAVTIDQKATVERLSFGQGVWGLASRFTKTSPIGAIAALFLIVLVLVTIFAGQIAPYPPLEADFRALRHPPNAAHWMGTDNLGRDVFSRLLYGGRISLGVALIATLISKLIGLSWGVVSGYVGSTFD